MDARRERVRELLDRMKPTGQGSGIQRRLSRPGYKPWEVQMGDLIEREIRERDQAKIRALETDNEEKDAKIKELTRQIEGLKKYQKP